MSSRRHTVAFLAGDGVGPELTAEASRALAAVSRLHGFAVTDLHLPFGGEALVRFGNRLPLATQRDLGRADAILVAAPGEPAFQVVRSVVDPVTTVTRVAHGDSSTLVVGPSEHEFDHVAVRTAFLLAARRRARVTSVGGSDDWSDLVDAEAASDARGIAVHHRTFGEALNAFGSGEHLDVVVADTNLHVALADALAVLGGTADAVARGWLPEAGAGLFAPAEVLDPTVAGYGAVDPASMLLAVSHLLAAGLREHAGAATLERAVAAASAAGYGPGAAKVSSLAATTRTFTDAVIARLSENRNDLELLSEITNDEVSP